MAKNTVSAGPSFPDGKTSKFSKSFLRQDGTYSPPAAQATPVQFTPADPSTTSSSTLVMMGFGSACTYTPISSGSVLVNVSGVFFDSTAETGAIGARYGTGTAPNNGDAPTGTRFGGAEDPTIGPAGASRPAGFAFTAVLALTPGTTYWFDLGAHGTSGNVNTRNVSMTFVETS